MVHILVGQDSSGVFALLSFNEPPQLLEDSEASTLFIVDAESQNDAIIVAFSGCVVRGINPKNVTNLLKMRDAQPS